MDNLFVCDLLSWYFHNKVRDLTQFTLNPDFTHMQFHKRLDQSQSNASTAGSTFSLEEAFKNLSCLFLLDSLARISYMQTQLFTFIFQRDKDITTCWSIFQGIAQEIEDHTSHLLLICHHLMIFLQVFHIQMKLDMLAFGGELEIAHPHGQGFHYVEAIEFQSHLSILNLSEIEDITYQLLQRNGITLHHLQEFPALTLDAIILQEHLHRVGNQR